MKRVLLQVSAGFALLGLTTQLAAAETTAAACWSNDVTEATRVHQLDVMLKVNSLLCRTGGDDFQAEYDRFLIRHRALLGSYNTRIVSDLAARMGTLQAYEELDRGTVAMANHYGERSGFGCHDLKKLTGELAVLGGEQLLPAANLLVGDDLAVETCPAAASSASAAPATLALAARPTGR